MKMAPNTKASGKMTIVMAKVSNLGLMGARITGILRMGRNMVLEDSHGATTLDMQETSSKTNLKVTERCHFLIIVNTMVCGVKEK